MPMKVVIDTNILIDAQSDDFAYSNRIVDAVIDGKIRAYANKKTFAENRLLCNRKIVDTDMRQKLENYFDNLTITDDGPEILIDADPEDGKLVASALSARADYLISSDKHLLDLGSYKNCKIVSPGEFWHIYESSNDYGWKSWVDQFMK